MLRPRITPCLLVHESGLVKTQAFKNPKYVGDPINAVKIFNEKEADELIVLDIDATVKGVEPNYKMIANLAAECRMPLCYGGGITTPQQAKRIIALGVEKVALSQAVVKDPSLIRRIADEVGNQSVVVVLDVRKKTGFFAKGYELCSHNNTQTYKLDIFEFAKKVESLGAGELVINSIDRDGLMSGYDLNLAVQIRSAVSLPLTFLGGAGSMSDIEALISSCGVIGAAAGSFFVFKGAYRAVLISYPSRQQKDQLFQKIIG